MAPNVANNLGGILPVSGTDHPTNPVMSRAVLCTLRSIRNGSFYGTKIRAPHALVMTFLFRKGTLREKLRAIIKLTFQHTKNLAMFVGIYKATLEALRYLTLQISKRTKLLSPSAINTEPGKPALRWQPAVAGAVGSYFVWSEYNGVNFQIVLYLLSRVAISTVKVMVKKMNSNMPHGQKMAVPQFKKDVYPYLAIGVWATVMWLFENEGNELHPSLYKSMEFLYHDSNKWSNGWKDFLPSPATAIVCLATAMKF